MKTKYDYLKPLGIALGVILCFVIASQMGCQEPIPAPVPDYAEEQAAANQAFKDSLDALDSNVKTFTTLPLDSEMKLINEFKK